MPIKTDSLQRKLCNLLNVRGYKPEPKNSEGKTSPTPEDADVIKFTFSQDGNAIDSVWVTIDSSHSLVVYYDDAVMREGNAKTPGLQYDDSWTGLLKQLKNWAQRRQLSFELKNKDHLASDMAQRTSMKKKEQVSEGYYPIGNKASYSDAVPNVKIILQHTRKIEEGEKRYRNISKIFVENTLGERFAVPTTKPGIARVYARHVAEGGSPYDSRGTHITSIVEEYTKMAGFVRATKNNQFNESTQQLIAEGINHYQSLRESLHKMTGHRGYNAYFESWTPTLNEETDDESSLGEMFVQETLDPRIESVMPILSKLQKKISEMKEVTSLEDWADDVIGEATDLKTIPENLGPEQKRVGQLGPTERVGKKGTIGKLVGANESVGEEVDEGWKQKLGAAALAGSMAMGANARVVPGQDEPGVNRLTGKPNIAQVAATDPVPDSAETEKPILKGFSASYLQKAADPNRFGRFMISVEDAKAELDRRAAAWERRSQGDQKINEGFLDEMHADLEELSEEDFEEEYNMTKAEAKEKYSSTGSWLNEQGVAEGLDEAVGGNYLYHATGGLKEILQSGAINAANGPQDSTRAQTKLPTVSTTRDWGYASGSNAQAQEGGISRGAVIVLDRNAVEQRYKTLGTSQSRDNRGLAFPKFGNLKAGQAARSYDTDQSGNLTRADADDVFAKGTMTSYGKPASRQEVGQVLGKAKHDYYTPKAGGEFEEAVVVPKGSLPIQGTMVGFWVNPRGPLAKDPAIMNDPRRLDMVKPNQFVKANQKQGVAEGSSSLDEYKRRLASIQSLRYDDPPEYAKKYSEILRLFPKEHHLYATGVQKADYSPGDRGSGTGRIGRVSEDEEMTQKKKEQVVTVKHKDSGKELRIVKTAVPDYQKRGYYPVKEQGVAEGSVTPDVTVNKVHDDGHEKEWHIYRGKEMIGYVIKNQPDFAEGLYIAYGHGPGRAFDKEFTGLKSAVNYITSLKEGMAEATGDKRFDSTLANIIKGAKPNTPERFIKDIKNVAKIKYKFQVGDWVTIDPNETAKWPTSGMIGRISRFSSDGDAVVNVNPGGGASGGGSSGTHTSVPTSMLEKLAVNLDEPGVAEGPLNEFQDTSGKYGGGGGGGGGDGQRQRIAKRLIKYAEKQGLRPGTIEVGYSSETGVYQVTGLAMNHNAEYDWRYKLDPYAKKLVAVDATQSDAEYAPDNFVPVVFDDVSESAGQGVAEGQLDEIFNPSSALAQILRTASQAAGDYIPIGLGAIGTFAATSALAGPVVAAMVGTTVGNSMLQSLQNNQNKIPGFIQKIVEKYFGNDSEGIEFALLHAKAAFLDKPEFRWRAQQWPVTLKKNDAEAIIEKNDKNWLEQHSQKSEQGVTESSDADQFENWKAAVRKQYPNEAGQIKFKGKGFGDSIVAEIPGRDQAFGEFNMGTGEAWVAPLDESQTMVREAQDELEAMLRIIRK